MVQIFRSIKFHAGTVFTQVIFGTSRGSLNSEHINVCASSNLFQNIFNFAISQMKISKDF